MTGKLILEGNFIFEGQSFGAPLSGVGEVVFSTGMVGYPESLTDPSYTGQILILTYPLIGNYGVFDKRYWESDRIHVSGLIVSSYINTPSHFLNTMTLSTWLKKESIPALEISDTRFLTQKIRSHGTMLGKMVLTEDISFHDPNTDNLVERVSIKTVTKERGNPQGEWRGKRLILIDCGTKRNIVRSLLKRGVEVITVPWNFDATENLPHSFDGIVISNGPGDPTMAKETIENVRKALNKKIPLLGICLGHQILALAGGGKAYKLKFGHRSQNQPCLLAESKRCYITTQNHGFAIGKIPSGFTPWFTNANDGSNEGIKHKTLPFMSIQFHPEACPGPTETEWIFDYFLERANMSS